MDNCFTQHQFNMIQRIDERLQLELFGIEQICNLFETAINEKQTVNHQILLVDDFFYLNSENILYPNNPPQQPYPLLEPQEGYVLTFDDLETIVFQLSKICSNRCLSLVDFSIWLIHFIKYLPHVQ